MHQHFFLWKAFIQETARCCLRWQILGPTIIFISIYPFSQDMTKGHTAMEVALLAAAAGKSLTAFALRLKGALNIPTSVFKLNHPRRFQTDQMTDKTNRQMSYSSRSK